MSEADSPNTDPGISEPVEPLEPSGIATTATDDEWQTVDFPGAMSVDAIAQGNLPVAVHSSIATPEAVALETMVQQLRHENTALHDRLIQLEQDLIQGQIEYQLAGQLQASQAVPAESPLGTSATPSDQPLEVEQVKVAQERLAQLFQELERSQQAAQRQQILVETLTEQLESSQARIAQLERDCAFNQQRYNEQIQQLLQAENTCRDLRLRLHRQQQHTLQFKAALEKCLEMPASHRQNQFVPDFSLEDGTATPLTVSSVANALTQSLTPKNQPVKPWSVTLDGKDQSATTGNALPDPLVKLLHPDQATLPVQESLISPLSSPADALPLDLEADDSQFVTSLMHLIFPDATAETTYPTISSPSESDIFDLSPFLDIEAQGALTETAKADAPSENVVSFASPLRNPPSDTELLQMLGSVPSNTDGNRDADLAMESLDEDLWDDLEKLIDPTPASTAIPSIAPPPALDAATSNEKEVSPIRPFKLVTFPDRHLNDRHLSEQSLATVPAATSSIDKTIADNPDVAIVSATTDEAALTMAVESSSALETIPPLDVSKVAGQNTPRFFTLKTSGKTAQSSGNRLVHESAIAEAFPGSSPSPVVYPLRNSKKLASLAAVDLPSFPRSRR